MNDGLISRIVYLSKISGSKYVDQLVTLADQIDEDIKTINRQRKIESSLNGTKYVELKSEHHEMFNYFCYLSGKNLSYLK